MNGEGNYMHKSERGMPTDMACPLYHSRDDCTSSLQMACLGRLKQFLYLSGSGCCIFLLLHTTFSFFQPAAFPQRFGNNPLKLPVGTTKLIGCPFLDSLHCIRIQSQDETFGCTLFLCHRINDSTYPYSEQVGQTHRHKALPANYSP